MKKVIPIVSLLILSLPCYGQTWDEWLRQKKTQKRYLVEQIVALQMYIGYVRKGYDIARKGLTTIEHIKSGDLDLHQGFFDSLEGVNPVVQDHSGIAKILLLNAQIIRVYQRTYARVQSSDYFDPNEVDYVGGVYSRLIEDCARACDILRKVIADGHLDMTDDQRLERIDGLYKQMQENYAFCKSFSKETLLLEISRMKGNKEVQTGRLWYGLK